MLYSDNLELYNGELRPQVAEAVDEIKEYFKNPSLQMYSWDERNIVIATSYNVSLPSRGSIDDIILSVEPIIIKISLNRYPDAAPLMMSDRVSFPKARQPHLYYSAEGKPATLCLVRGSLDEWFTTKTIQDFLVTGYQWFFKAATGTLLTDNKEFDPVRLETSLGKHVFKYETFRDIVSEDKRFLPKFPMAVILSSLYQGEYKKERAFKSISDIPFINLDNVEKTISKIRKKKTGEKDFLPFYTVLVWDSDQREQGTYFTNLPTNYRELREYLLLSGINIAETLVSLKAGNVPIKVILSITHAIKRPCKVIGYDGQYEFFTYTVLLEDDFTGVISDEEEVYVSSHAQPFTAELAWVLSNEKREIKTLFIGAGSLGSKIIMHDARSGKNAIGVVDHDSFQQHNISRHTLFSNHIGKNKAEAIIEEIKAFYELDTTKNLVFYDKPISFVENGEIKKYDFIVDSTASQGVMQNLIQREDYISARYSKCEIADNGEIGLLYIEGTNHNPRMDDLIYLTCYLATSNFDLEQWRIADADREQDVLDLGLGCNSVTNVMSDDLISLHASAFSQVLSIYSSNNFDNNGFIYLNVFRRAKQEFPRISNEKFNVKPFEIYNSKNDSCWTLRFLSGLSKRLLKQCHLHAPTETGGILIGVANYKTKTIHIYDIINEPLDSISSPVAFNRGIEGLPDQIDHIKYQTGQVIGYIGEWHTHPMNLEVLSRQDMQTIEKLQTINKQTPIPTCAVIVTKDKIIPFIYD